MRHHVLLLAIPFVLACDLLTVTAEQSATTTIDGSGILGELLGTLDFGGLNDFDVTVEQKLADQGVEDGDLQTVGLTRLRLSADPDLSFIEDMQVYVSASGIEEVRVAHGESFPEGEGVVDLVLDDVDLVDQVVAGGMKFRVDATGEAPAEDTEVKVEVEVEATATAQGACAAAERAGDSG